MNQLSKLQKTFQNCVLRGIKHDTTAWISAGGRADPEMQLSVYSFAYTARLNEVLVNDFPAVLTAVGEDRFEHLARDYIAIHPSRYFSLRDFGRQLPDFISKLIEREADYKNMHWLYELALFEWTLGLAFNSADTALFSIQEMSTISPEMWPELKFGFHPSVYRLDFEWNTIQMWKALTCGSPEAITAEKSSGSWLIWRQQLITRFRSLQIDEQIALDKVLTGASFDEVCEEIAVLVNEDEVPMHVASLLKTWITQDLITRIK